MVVKNTGKKIIGFGRVSVLPGQSAEIDDSYKTNDVVKTYKALGYLEVIEEKPAKEEKPKAQKGSKKNTPPEDETPETPSDESNEEHTDETPAE